MSNKEKLQDNNERLLAISEKLLSMAGGSVEPTKWEKGVNIRELGPGYFYIDAKLEEGDAAAMGLPEKYGAEWVGMYVVIRGSEDIYYYEAYIRDWYNDYLWHATLQSEVTWVQIFTSEHPPTAAQVGAAKAHEHYLKTYDNISRLGLTAGSETIVGVIEAMPNSSVLEYVVTSAHNASIYPYGWGKVLFRRISNSYASMTFWSYSGTYKKFWEGHAFCRDSVWEFYGWQAVVTSDTSMHFSINANGGLTITY